MLPHLKKDAVLTTNTSGLPVAKIGAALTSHRERFFGTHFFNPPRYMRLLEVIPAAESDPALVASFAAFADRLLGKQVVFANDTPNFIANRIGIAVMFNAANLMLEQGLTVEDVDALTGSALGFPRTGTFRLADMVGIDILAHVAANFPAGVTRGRFGDALDELLKRGWIGDKSGQGFYKKTRGADGKEERLALGSRRPLNTGPSVKPALPALEMAKNAGSVAERLKLLLATIRRRTRRRRSCGRFWRAMWNYAADRIGEVAGDAVSDRPGDEGGLQLGAGPV